jgi:hypothetical protein
LDVKRRGPDLIETFRGDHQGNFIQEAFMTEHEYQVEAGKEIVRAVLSNLAIGLSDPRVANLVFATVNQDFGYDVVSLLDGHGNVIAKIDAGDLADCPEDASVRARLECQLRYAIEVSFRPKK